MSERSMYMSGVLFIRTLLRCEPDKKFKAVIQTPSASVHFRRSTVRPTYAQQA